MNPHALASKRRILLANTREHEAVSTTLALLESPRYDGTEITLLDPFLPTVDVDDDGGDGDGDGDGDGGQEIQNPHAASIDSSRIIRPDYASLAHARLAAGAQERWRGGFGGGGGIGGSGDVDVDVDVYRESGVVLTMGKKGSGYVEGAMRNAHALGMGGKVRVLEGEGEVGEVLGTGGKGEGVGEKGYVNWGSGWADAGRGMRGMMGLVMERRRRRGGVGFRRGRVERLLFRGCEGGGRRRVVGARLEGGEEVRAELTVVAAGAWSGGLVDLRGRVEATGQVMAYVGISGEEKEKLERMPVLLNLSTGFFVIPPVWDPVAGGWVVKVARHSYGYANPTLVKPEGEDIVASLPAARFSPIPFEGEEALREFLGQVIPWLDKRPFSGTRICWYADTPTGDFLIDYHGEFDGLFLATGDSGHGYKFLPVLGERIVAAVERRLENELAGLWRWKEKSLPFKGTEDGSRGGVMVMRLDEELMKGARKKKSKL